MKKSDSKRPYFLWDYDLTEEDVRKILRGENETEKIWMMSRILESASFDDVWKYVTLHEVRAMFPKLKLKRPIREAWSYALTVWSQS
ncbi:hypothetical protein A3D03_02095 [Candidatus Gottesmanbacteria bacterium RIFCSPHIGHO2_02_FULL_40_13]|uniref:Uncharacterized protein n=1 Tax=Candidatus Gottesmanbacteria bacterium RIFCSPHIGHO2_02_FULL_40_13 TaxID=1798384 RepID=A0A1F6ABH9_9BACT|nr:MAG: hypothetical protein A3D03_02095 [Candidatus Gottesmanbacteria bacterium RIFCSPHIGHO2_02_FULL_40_13]